MRKFILFAVVILLIALSATLYQQRYGQRPEDSFIINQTNSSPSQKPERIAIVARNLDIPWAISFLPNNDILVTERIGNLKLISGSQIKTIAKIPDVKVYGEGGLLGLALDPNFKSNHQLFLYYTYSSNGDNTRNRIVRYKFENGNAIIRKHLLQEFGRIRDVEIGPDNLLYITTSNRDGRGIVQTDDDKIIKIDPAQL